MNHNITKLIKEEQKILAINLKLTNEIYRLEAIKDYTKIQGNMLEDTINQLQKSIETQQQFIKLTKEEQKILAINLKLTNEIYRLEAIKDYTKIQGNMLEDAINQIQKSIETQQQFINSL